MGSKVSVPPPSAEERELQKQQAETLKLQREILEEQRAQNRILIPFIADQEGYDVTTDEHGNITGIKARDDELKTMKKELEKGLTERSLKALRGELEIDPQLTEALRVQERDLRESLAQRLGPGYETTSAGIETLGNFMRNKNIVEQGARESQLTLAEQLGLVREQQNIYAKNTSLENLQGVSQQVPLTLAGAFGQNARGFGAAQQPFIQQRQMQLQASIANAQNKASMFGAGLGLVGALFSDDRLKTDLEVIGEKHGIPIYRYRYISTGTYHIGFLAQDVMHVVPEAVAMRDGYMVVNYEML